MSPITALAYLLTMGDVSRFPRNKQVASCLGLIPREHSSGGRQKRRRSPYPAGVRIESSLWVLLVGASETVGVDWALSHPVATGCSHRRIMADC